MFVPVPPTFQPVSQLPPSSLPMPCGMATANLGRRPHCHTTPLVQSARIGDSAGCERERESSGHVHADPASSPTLVKLVLEMRPAATPVWAWKYRRSGTGAYTCQHEDSAFSLHPGAIFTPSPKPAAVLSET